MTIGAPSVKELEQARTGLQNSIKDFNSLFNLKNGIVQSNGDVPESYKEKNPADMKSLPTTLNEIESGNSKVKQQAIDFMNSLIDADTDLDRARDSISLQSKIRSGEVDVTKLPGTEGFKGDKSFIKEGDSTFLIKKQKEEALLELSQIEQNELYSAGAQIKNMPDAINALRAEAGSPTFSSNLADATKLLQQLNVPDANINAYKKILNDKNIAKDDYELYQNASAGPELARALEKSYRMSSGALEGNVCVAYANKLREGLGQRMLGKEGGYVGAEWAMNDAKKNGKVLNSGEASKPGDVAFWIKNDGDGSGDYAAHMYTAIANDDGNVMFAGASMMGSGYELQARSKAFLTQNLGKVVFVRPNE